MPYDALLIHYYTLLVPLMAPPMLMVPPMRMVSLLLMVPLVRTLGDRCGVELVVQLDVELLGTLLGHLLRHVHLSVELLWLEEKHML